MNFLDTLIQAANIPEAAYITFLQQYKFKDSTIHLFYEGVEDSIFYNCYIQNMLEAGQSIQLYICDGKDNVIQNYNDINWTKYNRNRVLFFVDKDLEDVLNENIIQDENIFRTKHYSVESYLVTEDVLEKFLMESCNLQDKTLVNEVKGKFELQIRRFYKKILTLSSWIVFCRANNLTLNLNDIRILDFIHLDKEFNVLKVLPTGYPSLYDYVCHKTKTKHIVSDTEILNLCKYLPKNFGYKSFIRGKYELKFFFLFCKKIVTDILPIVNKRIAAHNTNCTTKTIRKCKLFSVTEENVFDILSAKVKIPDELKIFLKHNLKKAGVLN